METGLTWHNRWRRMLAGLATDEKKFTNSDVAEITGHSIGHINNAVQPSKKFPKWAKLPIVIYERYALK